MKRMKKLFTCIILASAVASSNVYVPISIVSSSLSSTAYAGEVSAMTVIAANGKSAVITGMNTTRGSGALIVYTPTWGYKTATNAFGAEVVVTQTGLAGQYQVTAINSAFADLNKSGNSEIPENGLVLSAGPGGTPDIRRFLTDNFKIGDLITINEPISQTSSQTAVAIDPTPSTNPSGAEFDGYRGPNQLLVYTPMFGPSTRTNQYGYEITVNNGVIVAVGGADSVIPQDGFVVSGHGTAAAWLSSISMIGAKVTVSDNTVIISRDVSTYVYMASEAIKDAQNSIDKGLNEYVNAPFEQAKSKVQEARDLLVEAEHVAASNPTQAVFLSRQAVSAAQNGYYLTLPSRVAEARGVWYRPMEKTPNEIRKTLDHMQEAGINELYLETWFGGYTIYPSDVAAWNGIEKQTPSFAGWDPLQVFVDEAKLRGIAVHAWLDGFMVGIDKTGGPVLRSHPEWSALARHQVGATKPTPQDGNGYFWLDVTNPQVRQYMLDITKEMVSKYGMAGVDLDFIRLPHSSDWKKSYNFSTYSRSTYQEQTGIDPYTIQADIQPDLWNAWIAWIEGIEDDFVKRLYGEIKGISPQVVVSATPEPGAEAENIGNWSQFVDVVIPQAYSYSNSSILKSVQQHKAELRPGNLVYSGIFPMYVHMGPYETVAQVQAAHDIDQGTTVFAFGQASPVTVKALRQGVWRNRAISTGMHPTEAIKALLGSIGQDVDEVYVPRGVIKPQLSKPIHSMLDAVSKQFDKDLPEQARPSVENRLAEIRKFIVDSSDEGDLNSAIAGKLTQKLDHVHELLLYSWTKGIK